MFENLKKANYKVFALKIKKNTGQFPHSKDWVIKNGYPDKLAKTYGEDIPSPDNKSAMLIPGTTQIQERRFPGLMNTSKNKLINCIQDFGYIQKQDLFDNSKKKLIFVETC